MPKKNELKLVIEKSSKSKKNYCYWDLGWKRIFLSLEDASNILKVSPEELYYLDERKEYTFTCESSN